MSVLYHPRKANLVVDASSRMPMGSVTHVDVCKKELVRDVHRLARLGVLPEDSSKRGFMVNHNSNLSLVVELKYKQHLDPLLIELRESVRSKSNDSLSLGGMGFLGIKVDCACQMWIT